MILLRTIALLAATHDIDTFGARDSDPSATMVNAAALTAALAAAQSGDTVLAKAGKIYYMNHVTASQLRGVIIHIAGTVLVDDNITAWVNDTTRQNWFEMVDSVNVTIGGGGTVDGQGMPWWDASITGSIKGVGENRPHLLQLTNSTELIIENLTLLNSPRFHIHFSQCARVVVRHVTIRVDRFAQRSLKAKAHTKRLAAVGPHVAPLAETIAHRLYGIEPRADGTLAPREDWRDWLLDEIVKLLPAWALQPEDLNTDGIDPNGEDYHVHDCTVDNDDDSIAVKPSSGKDRFECSQDMLFERLTLTGFGASVGSVPPSADVNCVRNLTFRNLSMPGTGKGIYIKSNPSCGAGVDRFGRTVQKTSVLEDITFEDVNISRPFWWAVWIGPQQQHEPGSALGDKCALAYPLRDTCPTQGCSTFSNITLRRVTIEEPLLSPGVILGNVSNPMRGLTLEDVNVKFGPNPKSGAWPWGRTYLCQAAALTSLGGTSPAPVCSGS